LNMLRLKGKFRRGARIERGAQKSDATGCQERKGATYVRTGEYGLCRLSEGRKRIRSGSWREAEEEGDWGGFAFIKLKRLDRTQSIVGRKKREKIKPERNQR